VTEAVQAGQEALEQASETRPKLPSNRPEETRLAAIRPGAPRDGGAGVARRRWPARRARKRRKSGGPSPIRSRGRKSDKRPSLYLP